MAFQRIGNRNRNHPFSTSARVCWRPPNGPPRGYRLYEQEAVQRISFIKGARDLGFSLRERLKSYCL